MSRDDFFAALAQLLPPLLRTDGFIGTGSRFRRKVEPFWHALNVQRSTTGRYCFVNLGATLSFFRDSRAMRQSDFGHLSPAGCEFETRLGTEWDYGASAKSSARSAHALCNAYLSKGRKWFEQYRVLPGVFSQDHPDDFGPRDSFMRAMIFEHCSDIDRALGFAEQCLDDSYFGRPAQRLVLRLRARDHRSRSDTQRRSRRLTRR